MDLSVVILAAGQGKRMRSRRPKVLQPLAGQPLLAHVLATARTLQPAQICVVYGHGGEAVQAAFPDADVDWALQAEQLGTGHAVMQALPLLDAANLVLVLCGDTPLLRPATLTALLDAGGADRLALLTAGLDDPTGYGRVIRDARGHVAAIVEEHRRARRTGAAARRLAGQAQGRQRPGRVLPDGHHRDGRARRARGRGGAHPGRERDPRHQ
jgi:bifunctional UDP-N-acetylglucosamine pyrophosphorylase/glucosamine-1-phosphate N-acetyltransferase